MGENLCECGCGTVVKKRYVHGHNRNIRNTKGCSSWNKGKGKKKDAPGKKKIYKQKNISPWGSEEHIQKKREAMTGERNPAWKGGLKKDKEHMKALGRLRNHRRRAREKQADGSFTVGEWELLKEQYGHVCPMCRKEEPEINLTMDHVIPLSKGGKNNISNIQPLCLGCNDRKFTKIFRITPDGDMLLF